MTLQIQNLDNKRVLIASKASSDGHLTEVFVKEVSPSRRFVKLGKRGIGLTFNEWVDVDSVEVLEVLPGVPDTAFPY